MTFYYFFAVFATFVRFHLFYQQKRVMIQLTLPVLHLHKEGDIMKKIMLPVTACLLSLLLLLAGCGGSSADKRENLGNIYQDYQAAEIANAPELTANAKSDFTYSLTSSRSEEKPADQNVQDGRKLIKTMGFAIETQDFDQSAAKITAMTAALGGYIENSSISGNSYQRSSARTATYVLRIPVSSLGDFNEKIDEIKSSEENNGTEDFADTVAHLPRFLLRFALTILRVMDYFGWIPMSLLNISPFHGSMIITDLGSLRIGPIYHHIYNFGTLPAFIAFGAKRHAYELNRHGEMVDKKYVDCKFVLDEGIVDGHYWAQMLLAYRYMFEHPEMLLSPPSKVVEDIA